MNSRVDQYLQLVDREELPLPYKDYDKNDGIYHNSDGGVSIIFGCKAYGGISAESGLITALSCLPEGAAIQFLLYSSPDITRLVDEWKKTKKLNDGLYQSTKNNYAAFIEKKSQEIMSHNMRVKLCDYKLIISVTLGGKANTFSVGDTFKKILSKASNRVDAKTEYMQRYNELKEIKGRILSALKASNLFPLELKPNDLIKEIYGILNPKHDFRNIAQWDDSEDISKYCLASDTVFEVAEDHIKFDNSYARSMSVKEYPYEWHCGMADHLIGNSFGIQTIETNVLYCLNAIVLGKAGINKVKSRSQIILSQKLPEHIFPRLAMKQRDLALANKEMERGKSVFHINFAIMPIASSYEELNNATGQLQSYYQYLGFNIQEDKYITLPIFLSMLPGNYDDRFKEDLKRGKVVFLENVVDLAPTGADWGGNFKDRLELFFFTPRGQLFSFDFFASNTNYNAFCIGTSGAGKSVALQYIAMNYLMSGDQVRIIDIGGSYENFCHILGGQYVDIKPEAPISLNPWTDITSEKVFNEFSEFLADWYWMMGSPADYKLAQEHEKFVKSWLSVALNKSFEKYGNKSNVDTVAECLKAAAELSSGIGILDERISDFIQILSSYMSKGIYGAFFNGDSQIELEKNIVVLETGSMENIPALRDPVLMILTYHISKSIYLSHKEDGGKYLVIIDEAHKFLGNHRVDGFVEQAYRRFRKHKASMIIGTQGYEDLASTSTSRAGRVIIDNSAFQIFMMQSPSSAEKLKKSDSHNFDAYDKSMIDSIKSIKGEYSEAILIHEKLKIKFRIILDDFMKKMFFTTPDMRNYIRARVREGMSFEDAVNSMPQEMIK